MRRNTRCTVSIIFTIILSLLFTNNLFAEHRLALLIGNSNYIYGGSLKNSVTDVRAMKKVLEGLGFTVLKYENATQKTMKRAMDNFGIKLKGQDVGLFFYSGHGVQVNGHNYLIPTNAKLHNENDTEYDCVRADRVLTKMESAGTKTSIVILDACRDNPFERSWRKGTKGTGLAFMNAPSGSLIAYSTAPGKTALDGRGSNSPYTFALLQHIRTPNITILEMFQGVRSTVMARTGGKQTPWESTSLRGNFYFNGKREIAIKHQKENAPPTEPTNRLDVDALMSEAYALFKNGNQSEAIRILDKVLELDPKNAMAYHGRAATYGKLKQHARAIQDYDKAIDLDPGNVNLYYGRGLAYFYLKQYARAIQDHNKAIELDPGNMRPYFIRGLAYSHLKQYVRAIQDLDKAIELDSNHAKSFDLRGAAYILLGKIYQGCADLQKACGLGYCGGLEWATKQGKCL